jgi:hypothetical protein
MGLGVKRNCVEALDGGGKGWNGITSSLKRQCTYLLFGNLTRAMVNFVADD